MKKNTKYKSRISEEREESKGSISSSLISEGKGILKSIKSDFWKELIVKSAVETAPEQLIGKKLNIGLSHSKEEQDLVEGEEILLNTEEEIVDVANTEEFKEYVRAEVGSETLFARSENKKQRELEERIQMILTEINKLKNSSTEMRVLLKDVPTDRLPVNPGKYHENFLEWVLLQIRQARERIDEGLTWLSLFSSKKKQKQYWNMFKKHGTTFGLSQERTTATQTG